MNYQFYTLSDNDILLFGKDTFTVERFKEFLLEILRQKSYINGYKSLHQSQYFEVCLLAPVNSEYNIEDKVTLTSSQSSLTTVSEEIECKLLKLGATSWKDGKLRFKANANYNNSSDPQLSLEAELEFCPNEPEPSEGVLKESETLDDLRRKLESL